MLGLSTYFVLKSRYFCCIWCIYRIKLIFCFVKFHLMETVKQQTSQMFCTRQTVKYHTKVLFCNPSSWLCAISPSKVKQRSDISPNLHGLMTMWSISLPCHRALSPSLFFLLVQDLRLFLLSPSSVQGHVTSRCMGWRHLILECRVRWRQAWRTVTEPGVGPRAARAIGDAGGWNLRTFRFSGPDLQPQSHVRVCSLFPHWNFDICNANGLRQETQQLLYMHCCGGEKWDNS